MPRKLCDNRACLRVFARDTQVFSAGIKCRHCSAICILSKKNAFCDKDDVRLCNTLRKLKRLKTKLFHVHIKMKYRKI